MDKLRLINIIYFLETQLSKLKSIFKDRAPIPKRNLNQVSIKNEQVHNRITRIQNE
jgi:hypothetical protein